MFAIRFAGKSALRTKRLSVQFKPICQKYLKTIVLRARRSFRAVSVAIYCNLPSVPREWQNNSVSYVIKYFALRKSAAENFETNICYLNHIQFQTLMQIDVSIICLFSKLRDCSVASLLLLLLQHIFRALLCGKVVFFF